MQWNLQWKATEPGVSKASAACRAVKAQRTRTEASQLSCPCGSQGFSLRMLRLVELQPQLIPLPHVLRTGLHGTKALEDACKDCTQAALSP